MSAYEELPHIDECRYLILRMIEQSVRDYLSLEHSSAPTEKIYYESACDFIFNDKYILDYGGEERSIKDFLFILGIDLVWFREKVVRLKDQRIKNQRLKRENDINIFEEITREDK